MNEMTYYLLLVGQQKDLLFSLKRMQQGVAFRIGPLQPLDYEMAKLVILAFNLFVFCLFSYHYYVIHTYLQLTNKIYTFLMVLMTFV